MYSLAETVPSDSQAPTEKIFKPPSSKKQQLNAADAVEIFELRPKSGKGEALRRGSLLLCKSVAPKYGVSAKTIRDIWRCRTWSHATEHLWTEDDKITRSEYKRLARTIRSKTSSEPSSEDRLTDLLLRDSTIEGHCSSGSSHSLSIQDADKRSSTDEFSKPSSPSSPTDPLPNPRPETTTTQQKFPPRIEDSQPSSTATQPAAHHQPPASRHFKLAHPESPRGPDAPPSPAPPAAPTLASLLDAVLRPLAVAGTLNTFPPGPGRLLCPPPGIAPWHLPAAFPPWPMSGLPDASGVPACAWRG
jgi:hypothetical protein